MHLNYFLFPEGYLTKNTGSIYSQNMASDKKQNITKEMLDEAVETITKAHKDQLDRIEAEVNFIKQDMRDLKIQLLKH